MAAGDGPSFKKEFDFTYKVLIIGDSCVGKTCLLVRYAEDSFNQTFISTIGIDFKVKTIKINDKSIKLQIWDTAGQDRFFSINVAYYRGAMGILLVYDVTDEKTFKNISRWIGEIENHAPTEVEKVLIGNKCDCTDRRTVDTATGEKLAKEFGIPYMETSAKENVNVNEAFDCLAKLIFNKVPSKTKKHGSLKSTIELSGSNNRAEDGGGGGGGGGGCAC
ncbi:hypothetical protein EMCRGX_G034310 [Ephydatia muelleri]|eukprot:Em0023g240a